MGTLVSTLTRDKEGYDYWGFDIDGYDKKGFDSKGVDPGVSIGIPHLMKSQDFLRKIGFKVINLILDRKSRKGEIDLGQPTTLSKASPCTLSETRG